MLRFSYNGTLSCFEWLIIWTKAWEGRKAANTKHFWGSTWHGLQHRNKLNTFKILWITSNLIHTCKHSTTSLTLATPTFQPHRLLLNVICEAPGDNKGYWVSWLRDLAAAKLRTDSLRMPVFVHACVRACMCIHPLLGREIHKTLKWTSFRTGLWRMIWSDPLHVWKRQTHWPRSWPYNYCLGLFQT